MKPQQPARGILLLFSMLAFAGSAPAQIGGLPGEFSRMGFGARGAGMGNAMAAVTSGDLFSYYNPAVLPFAEYRIASAALGVLSLDRKLNFLGYSQALPPNAGISVGLINAGVSNIDGRDADGEPTGSLRTSENEIYLGFATRLKVGIALGVNVKLLYYHLYTDISSTTAGVDLGALYPLNDALTLGLTVRDIESRYKWDSSPLYGSLHGVQVEDKFPVLYTFGVAYKLPDSLGIADADFEFSSENTLIARVGAEVPIIPELTIRAGIDRIDLKEKGNGIRPAFGFTVRKSFDGFTPSLHYAYVIEPFAPAGMHLLTLAASF
jgi:hypothetical protein